MLPMKRAIAIGLAATLLLSGCSDDTKVRRPPAGAGKVTNDEAASAHTDDSGATGANDPTGSTVPVISGNSSGLSTGPLVLGHLDPSITPADDTVVVEGDPGILRDHDGEQSSFTLDPDAPGLDRLRVGMTLLLPDVAIGAAESITDTPAGTVVVLGEVDPASAFTAGKFHADSRDFRRGSPFVAVTGRADDAFKPSSYRRTSPPADECPDAPTTTAKQITDGSDTAQVSAFGWQFSAAWKSVPKTTPAPTTTTEDQEDGEEPSADETNDPGDTAEDGTDAGAMPDEDVDLDEPVGCDSQPAQTAPAPGTQTNLVLKGARVAGAGQIGGSLSFDMTYDLDDFAITGEFGRASKLSVDLIGLSTTMKVGGSLTKDSGNSDAGADGLARGFTVKLPSSPCTPVFAYGIPFVACLSQSIMIKNGFTANTTMKLHSQFTGSGDVHAQLDAGKLSYEGTTYKSVADDNGIGQVGGISPAGAGVVITYNVDVVVGVGLPTTLFAGFYVSFTATAGAAISGAAATAVSGITCKQFTLNATVGAGVKATVLFFEAKVDWIEVNTEKYATWYPDIKACRPTTG